MVAFRFHGDYIEWVTTALKTITFEHNNFQRVIICVPNSLLGNSAPFNIPESVREETYSQWIDLDRVLVRLWEPRRVRTEALARAGKEEQLNECLGMLLPEMTKRGAIELLDEMWSAMFAGSG